MKRREEDNHERVCRLLSISRKTVKPWPAEIDQWTHYLHGPDNNAVAHDARVGPPRHMQWLTQPVVAGGRVVIAGVDHGIVYAFDGRNGRFLWKHLAPDRSDSFSMAGGTLSDVLVSDGTNVYLHQVKFNAKLERQGYMSRHLFSTSSLLDDAENHRSHWVLGTGDFSRVPVAYSWIVDRRASHLLRSLYGNVPADEFGPSSFRTLQQKLVADGKCRK